MAGSVGRNTARNTKRVPGEFQLTEKHNTAVESAVENAEHGALARGKQSCNAECRHKKAKPTDSEQHQTLPHTRAYEAGKNRAMVQLTTW
jgi:hypothetical protein